MRNYVADRVTFCMHIHISCSAILNKSAIGHFTTNVSTCMTKIYLDQTNFPYIYTVYSQYLYLALHSLHAYDT